MFEMWKLRMFACLLPFVVASMKKENKNVYDNRRLIFRGSVDEYI